MRDDDSVNSRSYRYQERVRGTAGGVVRPGLMLVNYRGGPKARAVQSVTDWYRGEPTAFYTCTVRSAREAEDFVLYLLGAYEELDSCYYSRFQVRFGLQKRRRVTFHPPYNLIQQALSSCWRFGIPADAPFLGRLLFLDLQQSYENLLTRIMRQIDDRTNGTRLPPWYPLRRLYDKLQYFVLAAKRATYETAAGDVANRLDQLESPRGLGYLHQAAYYINPRLISLLLRHGADPEVRSSRLHKKQPVHCLYSAFRNGAYTGRDDTDKRVQRCLRLFCRAMPRIPVQTLSSDEDPNLRETKNTYEQMWNSWVPADRWAAPCDLKHLCRCSVRRLLRERACLPDGIFLLPLPALLHRYLNLEHD